MERGVSLILRYLLAPWLLAVPEAGDVLLHALAAAQPRTSSRQGVTAPHCQLCCTHLIQYLCQGVQEAFGRQLMAVYFGVCLYPEEDTGFLLLYVTKVTRCERQCKALILPKDFLQPYPSSSMPSWG